MLFLLRFPWFGTASKTRRSNRRHGRRYAPITAELLEERIFLTTSATLLDPSDVQTTQGSVVEFPSDFLSSAFAEHNGVIYVNGRVGSNVGPDVYYDLTQSETGELQVPAEAVSLVSGVDFYQRPIVLRNEVVFQGFGIGDGQFRVIYKTLEGDIIRLPHPSSDITGSSPLAANVSGVMGVSGSGPLYITDLREEETTYVSLPVSSGRIGTVTAVSETGTSVFGLNSASSGPAVIWRRQVDSQTNEVSYVQMVLAQPSDEFSFVSLYRPNSITDDFATTTYGIEDQETFEITGYLGLWRSSDASFVRGFEGGHTPYITKHNGTNYLFFSAADPSDPTKQIVYIHIEGEDDARPLSEFFAENCVVFGDNHNIAALEKVREVQISDSGVLMILGTRRNSANQEISMLVRAQLAQTESTGGDGGEEGETDSGETGGGNTGGETGGGETDPDSGNGDNGGGDVIVGPLPGDSGNGSTAPGDDAGGGTTDPGSGETDSGNGGGETDSGSGSGDSESDPGSPTTDSETDQVFVLASSLNLDLDIIHFQSLLETQAFMQFVEQTQPAYPTQQVEPAPYEPPSTLVDALTAYQEKFRKAVETAKRFLGDMSKLTAAQLRSELNGLADMGLIDISLVDALILEFSDLLSDSPMTRTDVVPAGHTEPAPVKVASGTANSNAGPEDEEDDSPVDAAGMEEALKELQGAGSK